MLETELMRLLAVSCAVALVIQAIKHMFDVKESHPRYARLQPLVAMLLGSLGGLLVLDAKPVVAGLWGVIAGGFSSGGYEVVDAMIRGWKEKASAGHIKHETSPQQLPRDPSEGLRGAREDEHE